jgi:hypothetical protein
MDDVCSTSTDRAIVPAWWDPKRRKIVLDPSTFVPGVLLATRQRALFLSEQGLEFDMDLTPTSVSWTGMGYYGLDLSAGEVRHRVHLGPPKGGRRLDHSALQGISEKVTDARDVASVAGFFADLGAVGDVIGVAGFLGDLVQCVTVFSDLRQARRSREALRRVLAPEEAIVTT